MSNCSQSYEPDYQTISISENEQLQESIIHQFDNDSLIQKLTILNDSLVSNPPKQTRGFREFLRFLRHLSIVVSDIRGAIDGAKWGSQILGVPGAILGSIIVGASYSAMTGLTTDTRASNSLNLNQQKIELAYVNSKLNKSLIDQQKLQCQDINIYLPIDYQSSIDVGLYHNATLEFLEKDLPLEYTIYEGMTSDEIYMLHSPDFQNKYNAALANFSYSSFDSTIENYSKEDRIIQLFIDVYKQFPNDLDDINLIINLYIKTIQQDPNISETEKKIVFNALSTAAYSSHYWINKIED